MILPTPETYLRVKDIATTPATKAKVHVYKSGIYKGHKKTITAKPANRGLLPVTAKTIWDWVKAGKFPQPIKLSTSVTVWRLSDVERWIEKNSEGSSIQ